MKYALFFVSAFSLAFNCYGMQPLPNFLSGLQERHDESMARHRTNMQNFMNNTNLQIALASQGPIKIPDNADDATKRRLQEYNSKFEQ